MESVRNLYQYKHKTIGDVKKMKKIKGIKIGFENCETCEVGQENIVGLTISKIKETIHMNDGFSENGEIHKT